MHELGLSEGIVKTILSTEGVRSDKLRAVTLKVGALSSVSIGMLKFCMDLVLEQRNIKDVEVMADQTPACVLCSCGHRYEAESLFVGCPQCGAFARDIVDGLDVTIESVEVEDD